MGLFSFEIEQESAREITFTGRPPLRRRHALDQVKSLKQNTLQAIRVQCIIFILFLRTSCNRVEYYNTVVVHLYTTHVDVSD